VYKNSLTSSSMEQVIEDADFGFDVRYAVNSDWTVGAYWEFNGSDNANAENTKNGDTYVAAYHKTFGSIKFGRLCTAVDDLGIGSDEAFGIKTYLDNTTNECGDEGIRYDFDNGDLYVTAGYVQDKVDGSSNNEDPGSDTDYMDMRLGYRLGDFDISGFMSNTSVDAERQQELVAAAPAASPYTAKVDHQGYGAELVYSGIENTYLSTAYYATTSDAANDDNTVIAFAAGYTMGLWGFNGGYSFGDHDLDTKDADNWFVNTTYAVAPNTNTYVEVGGESSDRDTGTALAIGVEASF
jgi:predicted porin